MARHRWGIPFLVVCLGALLPAASFGQAGAWTSKAPMPTPRSSPVAGNVGGKIHVVGGYQGGVACTYLDTNEAYDPSTNAWTAKAVLPWRPDAAAGAVVNGVFHVVGGLTGCGLSFGNLAAYNAVANSWTQLAQMPTARGALATAVVGNTLYAIGGNSGNAILGVVEAYDATTNTWSTKAPLPTPRMGLAATAVNGIVYAIGGFDGTSAVSTVQAYNPATNTWTSRAPLPAPRTSFSAIALDGLIYAIGGGYTTPPSSVVEVYDPVANAWGVGPSMATARGGIALAVAGNSIFAFGGFGTDVVLGANEAFTPAVLPPSFPLTVTVTGAGQVVSSPAGVSCSAMCTASFVAQTMVTLTATPSAGQAFAGWTGACAGSQNTCTLTIDTAKAVGVTFVPTGSAGLQVSPGSLDFGAQSKGTTSPPMSLTLSNAGGAPLVVTGITVAGAFSVTRRCATIGAGQSCIEDVMFKPEAAGPANGSLTVSSSVGGGVVSLRGVGENSLVTHYYRAILRRDPDASGKAFWEAEAARMAAAGANVNEAWYAMAMAFFSSAEYSALLRGDAGFVTDLYRTFFNRAPDPAGQAYWVGQLASGMPREVLLASFMLSPEFRAFTQQIFGAPNVRVEIDTVFDFYRGLLARLPDSNGLDFWIRQFRAGQCKGASGVGQSAASISGAFMGGGEYAARGRTDAQFVGDLYNAFLRRGGDLAGVQYWIAELTSGRRSREALRQAFLESPEFSARLTAVAAQGCLPTIVAIDDENPSPLTPVSITTAGMDPALPVVVRYLDDKGYIAEGPPLRVNADGSMVLGIPPYVDQSDLRIKAAPVRLTITQSGVTSNALAITIATLPTNSDYGTSLGEISAAVLTYHALSVAGLLNELSSYELLAGANVSSGAQRARLEELLKTVVAARSDVERISADPTLVIRSGTRPDGIPAEFSRESVEMMDRVFAMYLRQPALADLVSSTAASTASAAKANSTAKDSVKAIADFVKAATNVAKAQDAQARAAATCPGAPQACGLDRSVAVAAGIGAASGMFKLTASGLPAGDVATATKVFGSWIGLVGAGLSVVNLTHQFLATRALVDSQAGLTPPSSLQAYDVGLSYVSAAVGLGAALGGPAILATIATPLAIGAAVVSLTKYVYDKMAEGVQAADDAATMALVAQRLAMPKGVARGRIYRTRDAKSPLTRLSMCALDGRCLIALDDANGNFEMRVPMGIRNTNYGALTVTAVDPISGTQYATTTVDLRGLNTSSPVLVPDITVSVDCYAEYDRCSAGCIPLTPNFAQCVNTCLAAWKKCLGISQSPLSTWMARSRS